jgi:hypothetical protein
MKTTMVLPDNLLTEIKVEAAHQHRKLNDLVPELLRVGLASQRSGKAGLSPTADLRRAEKWLMAWEELGADIATRSSEAPSSVSLLERDRGNRG